MLFTLIKQLEEKQSNRLGESMEGEEFLLEVSVGGGPVPQDCEVRLWLLVDDEHLYSRAHKNIEKKRTIQILSFNV